MALSKGVGKISMGTADKGAATKKLAAKQSPIYPVSLHYFLRDEGDKPRPVPKDVEARTEAYKTALPARPWRRAG